MSSEAQPETKTIYTIPEDVYQLFEPGHHHEPSEDNLNDFAESLKSTLRERLAQDVPRTGVLRFSSLGQPDRKLWLASRGTEGEEFDGKTLFKFLYGHVIEALLLFLIKEAGHEVTDEQREVEVDGVKGHIDAKIDGVVVDVKSASSYGYQKFKNGTILEDDTFGYVQQLSGYSNVLTPGETTAFIALDKVSGAICVSPLAAAVTASYKPEVRIAHLKEVLASEVMPKVCYPPVPDGKSGNMKLAIGCSYCKFKKSCWPDARLFLYSTGPRWLTTVTRTPEVYEVPQ